jgi:hypothetical protein
MNIFKFIESFTNDDLMQSQGSRRDSFGQFGNLGKNLALASIPLDCRPCNKAFAADINPTQSTPTGALQLALTLEYLERNIIKWDWIQALFLKGRDEKVFMQISAHETDHVTFLIAGLGGVAVLIS